MRLGGGQGEPMNLDHELHQLISKKLRPTNTEKDHIREVIDRV